MRYDFKLFDLAIDRIQKPLSYYMDFLEDRVVFNLEAIVDVMPNLDNEEYEHEEDVYVLENVTYKRDQLVGCKFSYKKVESDDLGEQNLYIVTVQLAGDASFADIVFDNKKTAKNFYDTVLKYIFHED